jgi:hypothetical protein
VYRSLKLTRGLKLKMTLTEDDLKIFKVDYLKSYPNFRLKLRAPNQWVQKTQVEYLSNH